MRAKMVGLYKSCNSFASVLGIDVEGVKKLTHVVEWLEFLPFLVSHEGREGKIGFMARYRANRSTWCHLC